MTVRKPDALKGVAAPAVRTVVRRDTASAAVEVRSIHAGVSLDVLRSSGRSGGYPSGTGAAGGGAYLNVLSSDWRLGPGGVEVGA